MFELGATLYTILNKSPPFSKGGKISTCTESPFYKDNFENKTNPVPDSLYHGPADVSQIEELIKQCYSYNASDRPTIEQAMTVPYIVQCMTKITPEFMLRIRNEIDIIVGLPL